MKPSLQAVRPSLVLLLLVLTSLCPSAARAGVGRWTNQGPFGGFVGRVLIDPRTPSTLYATRVNELYKSIDRGSTWFVHSTTLPTGSGGFLRIDPLDPTVFYMGTGRLLHRSLDGGVTWSLRSEVPAQDNRLLAFEIDPIRPATLYMVLLLGGIFKSTDGGATWSQSNEGIEIPYFLEEVIAYFLTISPSNPEVLYAGAYDVNSDPAVYKSTDGGRRWSRTAMALNEELAGIVVDPMNPAILYGVGYGTHYKSLDGGVSWARLEPPTYALSLVVDPAHPSTLWIGTDGDGVYKSTDGGISWTPSPQELSTSTVWWIGVDPEDSANLYAQVSPGDPAGVYRSSDGGATWSAVNVGLYSQSIVSLAASATDPNRVYAGTSNSGVFVSADGGRSWRSLAPLTYPGNDGPVTSHYVVGLAVHPVDPLTVYAVTRAGIFKSTDGGDSWSLSQVLARPRVAAIARQDPEVLYMGSERNGNGMPSLHRSIDGGMTWSPIGDFHTDILAIAIDPQSSSTLYVSVISEQVYKSTDGGVTWSHLELVDQEFSNFAALVIDPRDSSVVYAASADGYGIFKSTDGGASWFLVLDPGRFHSLVLDPGSPSTLFAARDTIGPGSLAEVYRSDDGGAHWTPYSAGLEALDPRYDVTALAVGAPERSVLYGASAVGVWVYEQTTPCAAGGRTLCLGDDLGSGGERFEVTLRYDTVLGGGREGDAGAISLDALGVSEGGILWFFDPTNPEVLVKVLDGCGINGRYWVFYAATTTAGFTLNVLDHLTGEQRVYVNLDETSAVPVADTNAFTGCPNGGVVAPPPDRVLGVPPSGASVSLREAAKGEIGGSCVADPETLCIDGRPGDGRFRVKLHYDTVLGGGREGEAGAIPLTPAGVTRGGILWFFERDNPEVLVKVLDGCATNGHYWLFYAATTTAGFTLTVEDTASGAVLELTNPDETSAVPVSQIEAFGGCEL